MASAARFYERLAGLVLLVLLSACASGPTGGGPRAVPADLRPFLPSPTALGGSTPGLIELHRRLLAGEEPDQVERDLDSSTTGRGEASAAARLLRAEIDLVRSDFVAAEAVVNLLPPTDRSEVAAQLVAGRAAEGAGHLVAALRAYEVAASSSEVAETRRSTLEPRAIERLTARADEALAGGRFDDAARAVGDLTSLRPDRDETLELQVRLATAQGDSAGALAALRKLTARHPDRATLLLQQARLEEDTGDAAEALEQLERLRHAHPEMVELEAEIARAKFAFRLSNAPDEVRALARSGQIDRAGFARLLYWLEPGVRSAPAAASAIATDILDDPARDEILRVSSLGLMKVDETLHLFEPRRPLRRSEAFRAVFSPVAGRSAACASPDMANHDYCGAAAACGLIPEAAECLASAPVSGADAVHWIRLASSRMGGP